MFETDREFTDAVERASRIIISNRAKKDFMYRRVDINAIYLRGSRIFQISRYTEKQVFQENVKPEAVMTQVLEIFPRNLRQINIFAGDREYSYKLTNKGRLLKNVSKSKLIAAGTTADKDAGMSKTSDMTNNTHNRRKNYILREGEVIPPLVDMGIFTGDGKVVKSMYDKYRQINRFTEMVDDVLKNEQSEEINVIDFGCGKSYLTFILYYYITEIIKKRANIVGLDLKEDVIERCNKTAEKYGYKGLSFEKGDIDGYHTDMRVDMVVTLHACDTATDYALYNAVQWNAKYILSVPCCQHELNKEISCETLAPLMKYGIIKERLSALTTDAIRGELLEYKGYRTNLLEFVDMAHSPKNILIRAVRANISLAKREQALREVETLCEALNVTPTLYKLFIGED